MIREGWMTCARGMGRVFEGFELLFLCWFETGMGGGLERKKLDGRFWACGGERGSYLGQTG